MNRKRVLDVQERPWPAAGQNPAALDLPLVSHYAVEVSEGDERLSAIELPDELKHAAVRRQLHFRAGRFCAREALRRLGSRPPSIGPARGDDGAPVWPAGVVGSITHTDGFAAAAVAAAGDVSAVGIDTERVMSQERARSVVSAVAWPSELAHLQRIGCDRQEALTMVFSAKEAVFKCLYPSIGRRFGFHDIRIVGVDAWARTFQARVVRTLGDRFAAGTVLEGRFAIDGAFVHTGIVLVVH